MNWPTRKVAAHVQVALTSEVYAQGVELDCGHTLTLRVLPAVGEEMLCGRCAMRPVESAVAGGVDPVGGEG